MGLPVPCPRGRAMRDFCCCAFGRGSRLAAGFAAWPCHAVVSVALSGFLSERLGPKSAMMSLTGSSECPRGTHQALMATCPAPADMPLPFPMFLPEMSRFRCGRMGPPRSGTPCHYLYAVVTGLGFSPPGVARVTRATGEAPSPSPLRLALPGQVGRSPPPAPPAGALSRPWSCTPHPALQFSDWLAPLRVMSAPLHSPALQPQ